MKTLNKEKNKVYYFEKLELLDFVFFLFKKKFQILSQDEIFYIDLGPYFEKVLMPLLSYSKIKFSPLSFKLKDIRDKNGELIRARIVRHDLFKFESQIRESETFRSITNTLSKQSRAYDFIVKGLTDHGIMNSRSVSRLLFLFEVININNQNIGVGSSVFIVKDRSWIDIYKRFASNMNINLYTIPKYNNRVHPQRFQNFYLFAKYFYHSFKKKTSSPKTKLPALDNNLFIEGRDDINFEDNGDHSDYFWSMNSDFPIKNILTKCSSKKVAEYLTKNGTNPCWMDPHIKDFVKSQLQNESITKTIGYKKEFGEIKYQLSRYNSLKKYWVSLFKKYRVRIFLSWNKFDNTHMALSDAMDSVGGVSAIWQMAYDGYRAIECRIHSDIHFAFSQHSSEVDRSQGSVCKYEVITGYPKTYARPLLIKRAEELKQKMRSAGAKNIIFSIDENSLDDSRWHTGHDLQRENYIKLIDQVLKNPSLGVIFKPKHGKTLQRRLGVDVYSQLKKAIKTGRCHLYDSVGLEGYATRSPPMLAALSADVCIHGHFSGTAAMECAMIGKPTLLIDREGVPFHKFYELLPKDKVIFHNWDDAIMASLEFFNSNKKNDEFGDWSSIIRNFDPFQDEKAAERIGKYLHSIFQGFEKGLDKDEAMIRSAEIYSKEWGLDKIKVN